VASSPWGRVLVSCVRLSCYVQITLDTKPKPAPPSEGNLGIFKTEDLKGFSQMQTATDTPVLETERLHLRTHRVDDLPSCATMWAEEGVTRFIGGKPLTEEETWLRMLRHAGHWSLLGFGYWVVEEKDTGKFLGEAGLAEFRREITPPIVGTPEAGWVFADSSHGKGYASEAMRAILAWGETRFGNDRTVCLIDPENFASLKLGERLGFKEEVRTIFRSHATIILGRGRAE
jgi:RimJ/RimL family protein N-acetyltransferase